jgi:hypothetical protein
VGIKGRFFDLYIYHRMCFEDALTGFQPSSWVLHRDLYVNVLLKITNEAFFKKGINNDLDVDSQLLQSCYKVFYSACLAQFG